MPVKGLTYFDVADGPAGVHGDEPARKFHDVALWPPGAAGANPTNAAALSSKTPLANKTRSMSMLTG